MNNFLPRAAALALLAVLLTACGGGGGSTPTPIPTPTFSNVLGVTVDTGPTGSGYNVNRLYASVKICQPGSSTQCATVDHVLVDTGSTGLRLLSSVITSVAPTLSLNRVKGSTGFPLLNCVQFVDNTFAWGPVVSADIVLGDKTAASVPIQLIADPSFSNPASACSVGGTAMTTAATLGANGILGLGLFREDCGARCVTTSHNDFYYTCTSASCTTTTGSRVTVEQQLKNPVALFATDNNGILIDLPAVNSTTANSLTGSLIFGIGTQNNNQLGSGVVLTTSANGHFTTLFAGQSLNTSFLDTGSNGLFFDSSTIPVCTDSNEGFYCPTSLTSLSATLVGANRVSTSISFSIDNATSLFTDARKAVLPSLSGPFGDTTSFDWGLPFFYGRRVFVGIEGQTSSLGPGPFFAF